MNIEGVPDRSGAERAHNSALLTGAIPPPPPPPPLDPNGGPSRVTTPLPVARKSPWPWVLVAAYALVVGVVVLGAVVVVGSDSNSSIDAAQSDDGDATVGESRPAVPSSSRPPGSRLYRGDGFTLYIGAAWSEAPNSAGTEVLWYVGFGSDFGSNVNVLTERLPFEMDLETYADLSIRNGPQILGSELRDLDRAQVSLANGDIGERIEWSATIQGNEIRVLQFLVVNGRRAVVTTYTTLEQDFASTVAEVEPYLLTVVPT